MRLFLGSLIIMALLSGCRGFYPASILTTPPSSLPLRHKRSLPAFREAPSFPHSESARTLSIDYTAGPGTREGDYLHLLRPQILFADLGDDSTSVGRSAFGAMALAGSYKGRKWLTDDRLDSVLKHYPVLGIAGYYDGNIAVAGSNVALGVGWNCMASLEGGGYDAIWHRKSNWPLFLIPQVGVYLFFDADISALAGFWVRGGLSMPGPAYVDGGISWGRFTGSFGVSAMDDGSRLTAGLHYQLP